MSNEEMQETIHNPDEISVDANVISDGISDFGDDPVDETPEPIAVPVDEPESDDSDEFGVNAKHNLRSASNVEYSRVIYKIDKRPDNKRPMALTIVPKRLSKLNENTDAWLVTENEATREDTANYIDRWIYGINQQLGLSYHEDRGYFENTLDNPNSKWEQGFKSGDGKDIYLRKPEISESRQRRVLTGAAARERTTTSIGLGVSTRIPLPHTGFHVALSARSTQEYLDLDVTLSLDKIKSGRDTVGIIYQNSHIGLVSRVWDFIRDSIKSANRQNFTDIDLGTEIRVTDLPILQWGMACTMYPDGYPLDLPCSAGPNVCRHVEHVNLDLDKLLWINTMGLSASQRNKLGNSRHQLSKMEVDEYQENSVSPFSKTVRISPNHKFELKVPTINEYIEAGEEWISTITNAAIELFGNAEENQERIQKYVDRVVRMSSLREYSHWVKMITIGEFDEIADRESICESLDALSGDPELVEKALKEIQVFIEESTIALIAIPNFACPKCEADHVTEEFSKHPELIPMDMLKHFFTLKDRRLALPSPNQPN